jgi:hypothetical protein
LKSMSVQKIASILRISVLVTFICNLLALPVVPGLVYFRSNIARRMEFSQLQRIFDYDFDDGLGNLLGIYLTEVWKEPYTAALTLFLLFSGICTAVILLQAIRVLCTIVEGNRNPFTLENAASLRRAALCCFLIAAAALARVVFSVCYYRSPLPLATYNALFVPMFAMGGLLCLVMSALFRQAAEMKAENDLTI